MTITRNETQVTVQIGPGVGPDTIEYVRQRLDALNRFAPRPIREIRATVTKPRDAKQPHAVELRASLAVGNHVLRSHEVGPGIRTAVDVVCDRLRRQLVDLPHGRRGDHVPHPKG
ncbi:MAG TPA: HPF/RaiA family ribosome-associated protein [Pseudonocardiaceae bacterium]|nr:HPF/RaiA family ribosome-associated protein [Pseudonocardiaceae bacterium]